MRALDTPRPDKRPVPYREYNAGPAPPRCLSLDLRWASDQHPPKPTRAARRRPSRRPSLCRRIRRPSSRPHSRSGRHSIAAHRFKLAPVARFVDSWVTPRAARPINFAVSRQAELNKVQAELDAEIMKLEVNVRIRAVAFAADTRIRRAFPRALCSPCIRVARSSGYRSAV